MLLLEDENREVFQFLLNFLNVMAQQSDVTKVTERFCQFFNLNIVNLQLIDGREKYSDMLGTDVVVF